MSCLLLARNFTAEFEKLPDIFVVWHLYAAFFNIFIVLLLLLQKKKKECKDHKILFYQKLSISLQYKILATGFLRLFCCVTPSDDGETERTEMRINRSSRYSDEERVPVLQVRNLCGFLSQIPTRVDDQPFWSWNITWIVLNENKFCVWDCVAFHVFIYVIVLWFFYDWFAQAR